MLHAVAKVNVVRPPVLDLAVTPLTDRPAIRAFLLSSLCNTVNPQFIIRNSTAIPLITSYIASARSSSIKAITSDPTLDCENQHSIVCDNAVIRESLNGLVSSLLQALTGTFVPMADGAISLRYYPPAATKAEDRTAQRLGAHVDGNFMTLLLSTRVGLQVPNPAENEGITRSQVQNYGMPTLTGEILFFSDEKWSYVDQREDEILVSLGNEFFEDKRVAFPEKATIFGPLLHRVNDGKMDGGDRISVPFLSFLATDGN